MSVPWPSRRFTVTLTFSDWTGVGAYPAGEPIDPDAFAETLFELLQQGVEELEAFNFSMDEWQAGPADD